MIYDKILAEKQRLETLIQSLETQISQLPIGKLICARNEKRCKWYYNNGDATKYLPKSERPFAEQLALKKYLLYQLDEAKKEKLAIDFYLRHHDTSKLKSQELLSLPDFQQLLTPHILPASEQHKAWMNTPYEKNPKSPEHLIHKTSFGLTVRSKSESLIATLLYTKGIPFRYECALHLGATTMYPDFTILHPVTGKIFYFEHFGMMDDSAYCSHAFSKLQTYFFHGIIPSINLITTYETKSHPLDMDYVEALIRHHFGK